MADIFIWALGWGEVQILLGADHYASSFTITIRLWTPLFSAVTYWSGVCDTAFVAERAACVVALLEAGASQTDAWMGLSVYDAAEAGRQKSTLKVLRAYESQFVGR